jgi:hypothetical protein
MAMPEQCWSNECQLLVLAQKLGLRLDIIEQEPAGMRLASSE